MKILLTGKTGQVGYELERSLLGVGEIIAVDRAQMDLSDLDQVREVIRTVKPDLIVNPAAYTAVDKAESEPELAMRINGEAPGVIAEEAKKLIDESGLKVQSAILLSEAAELVKKAVA